MKIGYSKTFPLRLGEYEKSWIEEDELLHGLNLFDITDEDIEKLMANVRKIQYAIRKQVIDFHYESNKAAEKNGLYGEYSNPVTYPATLTSQPIRVEVKPKTQVENIIEQMNTCNDIKVLETYGFIAKNYSNTYPEIQDAYDKKMNELLEKDATINRIISEADKLCENKKHKP